MASEKRCFEGYFLGAYHPFSKLPPWGGLLEERLDLPEHAPIAYFFNERSCRYHKMMHATDSGILGTLCAPLPLLRIY